MDGHSVYFDLFRHGIFGEMISKHIEVCILIAYIAYCCRFDGFDGVVWF